MEAAGARPDQIERRGLDEGNPAGIDSRDQADQEPGDAQRRQVAGESGRRLQKGQPRSPDELEAQDEGVDCDGGSLPSPSRPSGIPATPVRSPGPTPPRGSGW